MNPSKAPEGGGLPRKLTPAARRLAEEIAAGDDYCVKVYSPANWLTIYGLAEWFADDEYGGRLRLTAGCAVLSLAPGSNPHV